MRRVMVASPYAGTKEKKDRNVAYATLAMADSLGRGEAPFLPHLLYPQLLDGTEKSHRMRGMLAGLAWMSAAEAVVVYEGFGITQGMSEVIKTALQMGIPVEYRRLEAPGEEAAP